MITSFDSKEKIDKQRAELCLLVSDISNNNSESAYKKLFGLFFNPLFRFSLCYVKSRDVAEEIASDVLITLWQKRQELKDVKNIQGYALVIAKNLSLNVIKKNSRANVISLNNIMSPINSDTPDPEQILINTQSKKKIDKAVQALPAKCKIVFKLVKEEGYSYKEVAHVLNISVKTVDAHLVTARKNLRQLEMYQYCL